MRLLQAAHRRVSTAAPALSRMFASAPVSRLKRLPIGNSRIADFVDPANNLFYVDKAAFIPLVEKAGTAAVLLRPKRWGKTTFLHLLSAYYDSAHAAVPLVRVPGGDSWLAHSFSIVMFDIANVARALGASSLPSEPAMQEQVRAALDAEVRTAVRRAVARYRIPGIDMTQPATELLRKLGRQALSRDAPLFIFVDEYDAVLRTLAISSGPHAVRALAGCQGPLREFFGRFKYMLENSLASRVFMTGISAVGLDTTSIGLNITHDLSQEAIFNAAVGFTRADTLRAIAECLGYAEGSPESTAILATLRRWCNGYLFASGLTDAHDMYQSVVVVQLLDDVRNMQRRDTPSLTAFLAKWQPSQAVAPEPDRALMDYYAPSAAMATLLPKLVSGTPLAAPTPLAALSVTQQVEAAVRPSSDSSLASPRQDLARATLAHPGPTYLTDTERTVVRTLFYEGVLTHTPGLSDGLRVINDFTEQYFMDKFAQHLAADPTMHKAAEAFILRGSTEPLEMALAAVSESDLIWQRVNNWFDFDCSQRLQLLLCAASASTGVRWELQERAGADAAATRGRTHIHGVDTGKRRHVIVAAKQVNAVSDLEAFHSTRGGSSYIAHQEAVLEFARHLQQMKLDDLLALKLRPQSVKGAAVARDVLHAAMTQARECARRWSMQYSKNGKPPPHLDVYAAVAFGPLRWVIVPVPVEDASPQLAAEP